MQDSIVKIVDAKGVYPNALDRIIEEQKAYYAPAWKLHREAQARGG